MQDMAIVTIEDA